ncbi:MAG: Ran-binding zinc finger domain-containing protein [Candidatus Thermoplasmatota archaeon]|nr:Ran-binding zinc finger domain-containing protein [Candidatus Thermoplasmatota archaeon]
MAQPSGLVSFALVLTPNIVLFSFRILSPELNEALSNDDSGQIASHTLALLIGLILAYRNSVVHDHEFHRSKAISALSKTYKLEDRGLWEKGEVAIQKLEARAYSDFKGRKAKSSRRRMQGNIGELNRESAELEQMVGEHSEYTVAVDGIEQKKETIEEQLEEKPNLISRFSRFISSSVERSANRRIDRRKKLVLQKSESFTTFEEDPNSAWRIPTGTQMKTSFCDSCSTYNEAESNYCSSCGSLIA